MRRDIFIVGIRILGIWLLIEAINPLIFIIGTWMGYFHGSYYSQQYTYSLINSLIHLIAGFYLLFRSDNLFNFLEKLLTKTETGEDDEAV